MNLVRDCLFAKANGALDRNTISNLRNSKDDRYLSKIIALRINFVLNFLFSYLVIEKLKSVIR